MARKKTKMMPLLMGLEVTVAAVALVEVVLQPIAETRLERNTAQAAVRVIVLERKTTMTTKMQSILLKQRARIHWYKLYFHLLNKYLVRSSLTNS